MCKIIFLKSLRQPVKHELIEIGVSPRGTLAFMRAIQARAILNERDYCRLMILKLLATSVCAHRLTLTIEGEMKTTKEQIINEILHTLMCQWRMYDESTARVYTVSGALS